MKITKYITALCILLLAGCTKEGGDPSAPAQIAFGIDRIGQQAATRAAVDVWDNTTVGVAYAFGAELFTKSFDVNVADNMGLQHVNTGLPYPAGNATASFVGYHPVAVPDPATGVVTYDISGGDLDIMVSNTISGTAVTPITNTMSFNHKLTRITFQMRCKVGESYPEPVNGVRITGTDPLKVLHTSAALNLNTGAVSYSFEGSIFNGGMTGQPVPEAGALKPLIFDVMLEPGVPMDVKVQTMTGVKIITIGTGTALWNTLLANGGDEGKQYIVNLEFSGVGILSQDISIVDWQTGTMINSDSGIVWW